MAEEKIRAYIAVGDSMSIDEYPFLELRGSGRTANSAVGAASLLFRNDDELWPEFTGKDLRSHISELAFVNLCEDGATTLTCMDDEYFALAKSYEKAPCVVTVTLGGNDLLSALRSSMFAGGDIGKGVQNIEDRYRRIIAHIATTFPRALLILTSVYDPTDGSGKLLSGGAEMNFKDKLVYLEKFNHFIAHQSKQHNALFADAHKHFLGHGRSATPAELWYWAPSPIEPGARGASELRRLWFELLEADGVLN